MYAQHIPSEQIDAAYSATVKYIRNLQTFVQVATRIKEELTGAYISTRLNDTLSELCPEGYRAIYRRPEKWDHGRWIYLYPPGSNFQDYSCITLGSLDVKRIDSEKLDKYISEKREAIEKYTVALNEFHDNAAQYNNLVGYFLSLRSKLYPVMSQIDARFSRY